MMAYWNIDGNHLEQLARDLPKVRALSDYQLENGISEIHILIDNGFVRADIVFLDENLDAHVHVVELHG